MRKLITLIKESLYNHEERDYTKMGLNTAIILLAVPMVIEMFFEALFALVDAFFVAKYVGVNGVAVVGLTESVLTLIYSIAWGLAGAATALIARRIGENNDDEASKSVGQIMMISLFIGIIIAVFGTYYSEKILQLMGANQVIIDEGIWFTRLQFLSSPIIILLFTLGGALRGAGNASMAMNAVIIANLINIGLDFLFIPIMGLGIKGAAMATMIGRSVGIVLQLKALLSGSGRIHVLSKYFQPQWALVKQIFQMAGGITGQFLIQSASWVFLVRIISNYGSEVIAGYTIALRIIVFTILPSWGLANAGATLVGQNLGANQPEVAEKSAWRVGFINTGFLAFISVLFLFLAKPMVSFFDSNPIVVDTGAQCLIVLAVGYVFFGIGMVIIQAINGAGDTFTPTILNLICFWAIEIPLAYYLAESLGYKQNGVFAAIVIAESILAIIAMIYFKLGRWKKAKV